MEAFRRAEFKNRATDGAASERTRQGLLLFSEWKTIADGETITERLFLKGSRKEINEGGPLRD